MPTDHPPSRDPAVSWAGDRYLRVSFGNAATPEAGELVQAACAALRAARIPGLLDLTPAYTTVLVTFEGLSIDAEGGNAERAVREVL